MMIFVTLTIIAIFAFSDFIDFLGDKLNEKSNQENWNRYQQALLDYEKGKRKDYPCINTFFPYGLPRDLSKFQYRNTKK